jgi:hypothetical protein
VHELYEMENASFERMNNFEFDILSRMDKLENGLNSSLQKILDAMDMQQQRNESNSINASVLDASLQKVVDAMDMQQQRNENNRINASVVDATERTSTSSARQK